MRENEGMPSVSRALLPLCAILAAAGCFAQSKKPDDLGVGKILVTTRGAADPHFTKSVILLVRYNQEGALGLMIHRRSDLPISQALHEWKIAGGQSDPVFVGGPVELDTVFALHRGAKKPEGAEPVAGDINFIVARPALEKAIGAALKPTELRVYLGYCGWGPNQLENEMRYGLWYIFDHSEDLAFDDQPSTLWSRLIEKAEGKAARLLLPSPPQQRDRE
jgi:putative transcriptional regulator